MVKHLLVVNSLLGLLFFSVSCKKDKDGAPQINGGDGTVLLNHIQLSADTACVLAPNVFTPNSDGINDLFVVLSQNMSSLSVTVKDPGGDVVFTSQDLAPQWDGNDTTGTGPYMVHVAGITTSGITLSGRSRLHVLTYGTALCLTYSGAPVTPDQFDPRTCGPVFTSNDIFCQ